MSFYDNLTESDRSKLDEIINGIKEDLKNYPLNFVFKQNEISYRVGSEFPIKTYMVGIDIIGGNKNDE